MNFKIGLFVYVKAPAVSVIGNIINVYISWMITDSLTITSLSMESVIRTCGHLVMFMFSRSVVSYSLVTP